MILLSRSTCKINRKSISFINRTTKFLVNKLSGKEESNHIMNPWNYNNFHQSYFNYQNNYSVPQPNIFLNEYDSFNAMDTQMSTAFSPAPIHIGCGELRVEHAGQTVQISGRLSKKRIGKFAEIKDRTGHVQLVINDKYPNVFRRFSKMPVDCVLTIIGKVYNRPENSINSTALTGKIEIEVEDILNVDFSQQKSITQKRSYSTMSETSKNFGITRTEYNMTKSENILKYFENRQCTCNDLRKEDINKDIQLVGWFQNLSANNKFQHLKDGYGQTQIIFENKEIEKKLDSITENTIVLVKGRVVARPQNNFHKTNPTGEIEILVQDIEALNPDDPYNGPVKDKKISKLSIEDNTTSLVNNEKINEICTKLSDTNKFTIRTNNCGELRISNVDERVTICGWLEFQRMNTFLVLRDGYGQTQVIIPDKNTGQYSLESIMKVTGKVIPRPKNMRNSSMKTGEIEILAENIEILNSAKKNLPFDVRNFNKAKETLRLEHRYIDLRFSDMQKNLRMRSSVLMKMREYLINYLGFVEVETPTLFCHTPGGAQEFIVPTRKPDHFYSLVQSPQQFKQMLMAGAIDRYFQIARCYRDESTRPDRQPEFTQLDIELSFTNSESIMKLIEETLFYCWPIDLPKISMPFKRMTYDFCMSNYGSDKPDIRYDFKFNDVTDVLRQNENISKEIDDFVAYTIVFDKSQSHFTQAVRQRLNKIADDFKKSKFVFNKIKDAQIWSEGLKNMLTENVCNHLTSRLKFETDVVMLLAYGPRTQTQSMFGRIRLAYIDILKDLNKIQPISNEKFNFLWVTDFPLFLENDETGAIETVHHPFTAPAENDAKYLLDNSKVLNIRSQAYDLVLNGEEIGGGSIRIHNREMQTFVLKDILKIEHKHLEHLLNALESGCPPHGGIALGLDRLLGIMCNAKSIRDVIAFPKGLDGKDHLSKAPVQISNKEKQLYHIKTILDKNDDENVN